MKSVALPTELPGQGRRSLAQVTKIGSKQPNRLDPCGGRMVHGASRANVSRGDLSLAAEGMRSSVAKVTGSPLDPGVGVECDG